MSAVWLALACLRATSPRPLTTMKVTPTIDRTSLGLHGKGSTEAVNTARKRDDYLVILDIRA
jgi:hypothetical protein